MFDTSLWVVLVAAGFVVLSAVAQSVTGFGFSIMVLPSLTILFGVREGILLTLLLSWVASGLIAWRTRGEADYGVLRALTAGGLLGLPAGVAVFHLADTTLLAGFMACVVLLAGLSMLFGLRVRFRPGARQTMVTGVLSGVLAGSVGLGGPPLAVFLAGTGLPMRAYRATVGHYFARVSLVLVLVQLVLVRGEAPLLPALVLVPAVLVGSQLGGWIFKRVPQTVFDRLVIILVCFSGAGAVLAAARS